jgi:hypothetical protein
VYDAAIHVRCGALGRKNMSMKEAHKIVDRARTAPRDRTDDEYVLCRGATHTAVTLMHVRARSSIILRINDGFMAQLQHWEVQVWRERACCVWVCVCVHDLLHARSCTAAAQHCRTFNTSARAWTTRAMFTEQFSNIAI